MLGEWEFLQRTLPSVEDWMEQPRRHFLPEAATSLGVPGAETGNSASAEATTRGAGGARAVFFIDSWPTSGPDVGLQFEHPEGRAGYVSSR